MQLFELRKQKKFAMDKMDNILSTAEAAGRELSQEETLDISNLQTAVQTLGPKIRAIEAKNTIFQHMTDGKLIPAVSGAEGRKQNNGVVQSFSADYAAQFLEYVQSNGQTMGAALYEGSSPAGGYAVPVIVDDVIVPLAPNEMAVRQLATVIPTVADLKIPQKGSFGVSTAKAESGSSTNAFTENDPTIGQITLSAFMAGNIEKISWELAQDVPAFQAFAVDDLMLAQQMYEENLYINGTGSGQPQGLLTNVGAGVTGESADSSGNLLSVAATFDVLGKLNAVYHPGASWLMQRATAVELRKAQAQSNLFVPVFTRVGTQDYLHGYPVFYSQYMPAIAAGATPVLFGDFKRGYVIGDRGGSGINVKVLDQPFAVNGQIALLAYRRTDGRVRRSEAIQSITLHT
jgi:HK97 family phage major capsid protein